ncbi:MAG: single-stranded DNA-binding protein [Chloroflexota bacterium]|nr:single-stranded DNA-binding protein [Chloroflexota bacterium]
MFHKITIIGNLGGDPEMRYTQNGKTVTNFSVAANRKYTKSDGEKVEETVWFRITVWGRQAETCNQYLKKGKLVRVEGRLNADPATGGPRIWTGNDGQPRASFEITAQSVLFLSSRDAAAQSAPAANASTGPVEEDIPF